MIKVEMILDTLSIQLTRLLVLSIGLSLFFYSSVNGQRSRKPQKVVAVTPCTLGLKDAPEIRGLRLGMTKQEFFKLFPSATERDNSRPEVGAITYEVNQDENPNFVGSDVSFGFVWFVDDKLSSVGFDYPNYEPASIKDFVRQAAAKLNLPATSWQNGKLKCKDFEVLIGQTMFRAGTGTPYLILSDYSGDAKITAREKENERKEAEERRRKERERQTFKP